MDGGMACQSKLCYFHLMQAFHLPGSSTPAAGSSPTYSAKVRQTAVARLDTHIVGLKREIAALLLYGLVIGRGCHYVHGDT